jgi:hypothetical protein
MDELRVPKRRVSAVAMAPGGASRRVTLFLAEAASAHAGPERPSDVLNAGRAFVPALDEEAASFTLLNVATLVVVRVDRALEDGVADPLALPTEQEVEVLLETGEALRGVVSYERPPERSRLVDFLNEPEPFFPLVEERAIALVNKRHVARVLPVES